MSLSPDKSHFTCERCHQTFRAGNSDEEARAVADATFGPGMDYRNDVVLCEGCYKQFRKWFDGLSLAERARMEGGGVA